MATKPKIRVSNSPGWTITETTPAVGKRRGLTPAPIQDDFLKKLAQSDSVEVVHTGELSQRAQPQPGIKRGAATPEPPADGNVVVEVEAAPDETHVLMVRHPSQAITFHFATNAPATATRKRRNAATTPATQTVRFSISIQPSPDATARRGLITSILKTALLKITGKIADMALPAISRAWENLAWRNRKQGWKLVTAAALQSDALPVLDDFTKISKDAANPNLLLIHGTFSNALAGFKGLGTTPGANGQTVFQALSDVYGDRIFAFDHFTVSKTPRENAQDLLDALPAGEHVFDVVTHSRGGLVLRHLAELSADFGNSAAKVKLRRVVLVACPNQGTPLATPAHFDQFVTWISNVLDLFPDNPFTDGISFVSDAIGWLAHRIGGGAIPGLAAMDANGNEITALEGAAAGSVQYSALVSNFKADQNLLARIGDAGLSLFFHTANDLVVPSAGGWKTSAGVPTNRIGCYGSGGNLQQPVGDPVSHISFFRRSDTVDFLTNSLRGNALSLTPVDPAADLPFLFRRGPALTAPIAAATAIPMPAPAPPLAPLAIAPPVAATPPPERFLRQDVTSEIFHLSVVDPRQVETGERSSTPPEWAILTATFRNARIVEKMQLRHDEAGKRFQQIIGITKAIQGYIDGSGNQPELPHGDKLANLGSALFDTLFQGDIKRLYDVARAEQTNKRINFIFTSQVDWLADLPLEFTYDPVRKNFLATSEVNFTRNVMTAVPADLLKPQPRALRILVVVAQPLGLAHLSVEEEEAVILSGFKSLIDAGLAVVDVLIRATPGLLHRTLQNTECDILHFIGHGEFDHVKNIGCLVFETESGGIQKVESDCLQQILCRRQIRLVFLNACETGTGGRADFNKGVAPALVQGGVPAVIGNQYSVLDVSATAFARHLYWSLGQGHSIGDAAREARVAVNYLITGEAIDWAVPVLFARDPSEQLCSQRGASAVMQDREAAMTMVTRRGFGSGRTRVGLWDVQRVIPHLDQIAARLTGAQDTFEFEAVSIPAPLGTWRKEGKGDKAFLRADKVVDRIREKPKELGVKHLIAFTNLPMSDGEVNDLYAWDEDPNHEISLFSTFQFLNQLDPPRISIERMVANAAAGFLSAIETGAHDKPPKDCPMFYNPKREVQWVAGRLEFCKPDEKRIDPSIRNAVKALLLAYP